MRSAAVVLSLALVPAAAHAQGPCSTITLVRSPATLTAPFGWFNGSGGSGAVWVSAATPDCTWVAQTAASWISFPDGGNGAGSRWLRYNVAPFTTPESSRGTQITVAAGQTATLNVHQSTIRDGTGLMQSPAGWTNSPSTAVVAQPFRVTGYAVDSRATSGPGISGVDIYWRNADNYAAGFFLLGQATYGAAHPHVADTVGSEFLDSGFTYEVSGLPISAPGGSVSIEAYARSTVDGSTRASGATRVTIVAPAVVLAPDALQFGAVAASGAVSSVTPGQPISVQGFGWNSTWTATVSEPWIVLSAATGTGPGMLTVSIDPAQLPASAPQRSGAVRVTVPDVSPLPVDVPVRVDLLPATGTAPPRGAFDPPAASATGAVPFGGWALDDVGVATVAIYRNRVPGESGPGLVFIGNATFVEGARPDVASANPLAPQKTRAGWGYMLLSNVLPNGGNGTFTFFAYAIDVEGKQTLLGGRDVTLANAAADLPFGAIDTPAPGETIPGVHSIQGWALTSTPSQIRIVHVYLDGQNIGFARYGLPRPDVTALFGGAGGPADAAAPGYAFTIDTRGLANGLHTIAVLAISTNGDIAGIGSRYFSIRNQ